MLYTIAGVRHTGDVSPAEGGSLRWAQERGHVVAENVDPVGRAGVELRRSRRENVPGGRQHRHVVKVTPEEEAVLLRLASEQGITVPRLLVEAATAGGGESATQRRQLLAELFALHRLLGSVANNVNQIAKATNATLESQPETAAALQAALRLMGRLDAAVDGLSVASRESA